MAKFKPGQSGNPGGRPKGVRVYAQEKCGADGKAVIDALWELATGKDTPAAVRLAALKEVKDTAFGRPTQSVEHSGVDGGPIETREMGIIDASGKLTVLPVGPAR